MPPSTPTGPAPSGPAPHPALTLRAATPADVPAILEIYNHAVQHTTASYDLEPVSLESRMTWFTHKRAGGWPVLVAVTGPGAQGAAGVEAEAAGEVVGWATFGPYREKAGYALTVEHSVYVRDGHRGAGTGRQLMQALIGEARGRGLHVMIGGVDAENAASIAFHEGLGFERVAHLRQVGRKFGRWLDLVFLQLTLEGAPLPEGGRPGAAP